MIIITVEYNGRHHKYKYKGYVEMYYLGQFLWIDNNGHEGDWEYRVSDALWIEDVVSIEGK